MNNKGFTLIELLTTLVILGIIVGFTIVSVNYNINNSKEKTEEIFIGTIEDALKIYIDSDAKKLSFGTEAVCTLNKTLGSSDVYMASVTFDEIINSTYKPILKSELVNPANKDTDKYECNSDGALNIYRDDDYVYYYKIDKSSFGCLNTEGYITNLPSECSG